MEFLIIMLIFLLVVCALVAFFMLLHQQNMIRVHSRDLDRFETRILNKFDILSRHIERLSTQDQDTPEPATTQKTVAAPQKRSTREVINQALHTLWKLLLRAIFFSQGDVFPF